MTFSYCKSFDLFQNKFELEYHIFLHSINHRDQNERKTSVEVFTSSHTNCYGNRKMKNNCSNKDLKKHEYIIRSVEYFDQKYPRMHYCLINAVDNTIVLF